MYLRYLVFVLACASAWINAYGQEVFTLKGIICKKQSAERVPQVLITNLRSKDIMMSDELGFFSIKASVGDTLLFKRNKYADLKIKVTDKADIPVYLESVTELAEVTIKGQTKRQELSEVMGQYRGQGTFYDGKPPILSFLTSPVTGFYELFGKTPQEAKRFSAYAKEEIKDDEVNRRYTLKLVRQVTGASDSVAQKFMEYYKPSYEDLKEWNDYDLVRHIKKSYAYYDKNKDKLKLQNINAPALVKPEDKKK